MSPTKPKLNRLENETSPYLKQHSTNPVDWYPWGEQALKRSEREQKPIFLSIGYSACHWCHVMERESFEDVETAKIMNEYFINIKVDREERPDLDHIYMNAVQAMTQHGGWPMSVFLTPELEPFYCGTYFPPEDHMGMPSFKKILLGVASTWKTKTSEIKQTAKQVVTAIKQIENSTQSKQSEKLSWNLIEQATQIVERDFDSQYGGFGSAPKFFHTMDLHLCLRHWQKTGKPSSLEMVLKTLDSWACGGIYDQLGGGFHRYSTDPHWLVPHFEKMLYDNALITELYLEAFQVTQNIAFAHVARETLDYVLREMTSQKGGFFSTQDADSEGEEGKFYVWSFDEIFQSLDKDIAKQFTTVFDVKPAGNWEGKSILQRKKTLCDYAKELNTDKAALEDTLAVAKRKLLEIRSQRVAPFRDEKILVSWNGLMIETFAKAYQCLDDTRYLEAAKKAAHFIWNDLIQEDTLFHCYKDLQRRFPAYLDDYANFINSLLSLYESDFDPQWINKAKILTQTMLDQFWDESQSDFFYTAKNHEQLITRPKDIHDGAVPSATSMAVMGLLRLGHLTGEKKLLERAEKALSTLEPLLRLIPRAAGQLLVDLDFFLASPMEIVIAEGNDPDELEEALQILRKSFTPNKTLCVRRKFDSNEILPTLSGKKPLEGKTTFYFCENFNCQNPFTGIPELEKIIKEKSQSTLPDHGSTGHD